MNTTTFRILDTISAELGKSFSINQLTAKIKERHGTAHYVNIYKKLHNLEKQQILTLNKIGKSSIVRLNFQNYLLTDLLTEMEIERKLEFLQGKTDLQMILAEMYRYLSKMYSIKSICSMNQKKNMKLNRLELLFLLKTSNDESLTQDEITKILTETKKLQNKHNLKIDCLLLEENEFSGLLESNEINPLKEILYNKTAFFCPQAFWDKIREIVDKGIEIRTKESETKPAEIAEMDLINNLARFGYREFGSRIGQGQEFCIEYIITALLMQGDARRIETIPIILAKHNANSNLLIFLAQKFGLSGRLLGLLKILEKIKPMKETKKTIGLLEALNVEEIKADEESILQKMRLYNAA